MINAAILEGRITKLPILKYKNDNTPYCSFSLAVPRIYEEECDYINCVAFKKNAENLCRYINKGNLIGVKGKLQSRKYEKNGMDYFITEILVEEISFLEKRDI